MTVKPLLCSLTTDSSGLIYLFLCFSSVLIFWADLQLGGTLLFPIDDKKSRRKGQDLVRMRRSILSCSPYMILKLCSANLMSFSQ